MRDVLQRLTDALERGREQIVCQVVETKGSTPQKAGALMVVDPDGGQAGTLGGGCVEAEVKQKAIRRIGEIGAEVHSFILDHDYAWADGLICGGKMVIAAEALRGLEPLAYFRIYQQLLEAGEGYTEAVVVNEEGAGAPVGSRFLFDHNGTLAAAWPTSQTPDAAAKGVIPLSDRPRPSVKAGVAFLPTLPRIRLIIVGGGHVGQGVANLAAQADFEVWVVDDRHQYANPERFPMAAKIVVGPIDEVLPALEITSRTYALIVTRGHGHDQEALYHLAPTPATYVGLIGSRRKIRLIFASLRDMGFSESALQRVAAPVGLEIGSQTVPEIAISIVAELIARRNLGPAGQATRPAIEPAPDEVPVSGFSHP
ncbi:XdhC family protein [Singulisphaera acidiphila]|uniref:Xanthine and CO dehydrogenases maturation factor, XdhC/CoxF family n=1 Tax=Singulisphaera acidiphila (strain ATCC BAA-1392 / DSM 18658 / VKM B-2454 / MOB10) TaxID=886293 RepID=L0DFY7_SINAD|nr:XdhC/CoxI family protein [Singulisphaera acidiphila]AGA27576.1 xanthine and CO dehydrogenases maturation factor, XdhC/CoxF family [Singulisphaera acidiphila DSM 18658]